MNAIKAARPGFFSAPVNRSPYVKAVLYGAEGTGKTRLAVGLAVGLWKKLGADQSRPIAVLESEPGLSAIVDTLEGVPIAHRASGPEAEDRVSDLLEVFRLAREGAFSGVVVDSLTHYSSAWTAHYGKELGVESRPLNAGEKGEINSRWRKSVGDVIRDGYFHLFLVARASAVWDSEVDQDTQRRESHVSGSKIRSESETGYEVGLIVRCEREEREVRGERSVIRRAFVEKDRTGQLDGRSFGGEGRYASFSDFGPIFDKVLSGSTGSKSTTKAPAPEVLFKGPGDGRERGRQAKVLGDEISEAISLAFPGSSKDDKLSRATVYKTAFGTVTPDLAALAPEVLSVKRAQVAAILAGMPHAAFLALDVEPEAAAPTKPASLAEAVGVTGPESDPFERDLGAPSSTPAAAPAGNPSPSTETSAKGAVPEESRSTPARTSLSGGESTGAVVQESAPDARSPKGTAPVDVARDPALVAEVERQERVKAERAKAMDALREVVNAPLPATHVSCEPCAVAGGFPGGFVHEAPACPSEAPAVAPGLFRCEHGPCCPSLAVHRALCRGEHPESAWYSVSIEQDSGSGVPSQASTQREPETPSVEVVSSNGPGVPVQAAPIASGAAASSVPAAASTSTVPPVEAPPPSTPSLVGAAVGPLPPRDPCKVGHHRFKRTKPRVCASCGLIEGSEPKAKKKAPKEPDPVVEEFMRASNPSGVDPLP